MEHHISSIKPHLLFLTETQLSVTTDSIDIRREIAPKAKFSHSMRFLPRVHGQHKIIATFNSKELFDVNGSKTIIVARRE